MLLYYTVAIATLILMFVVTGVNSLTTHKFKIKFVVYFTTFNLNDMFIR